MAKDSYQEAQLLAHVRNCTLCRLWADTGGGYLLCSTAMDVGGNLGYAAYRRTVETVRAELRATRLGDSQLG